MLIRERNINGGIQKIYKFQNGYGASIVKSPISYGLELCVIEYDDDGDWSICYSTPITDDVLGYLTHDKVEVLLEQIEALPADIKDTK